MLYADSKETVPKQEFSRRFAKENITKNQALDVKRNLKLLENVNITNMCKWTEYWKQYSVFYILGKCFPNILKTLR